MTTGGERICPYSDEENTVYFEVLNNGIHFEQRKQTRVLTHRSLGAEVDVPLTKINMKQRRWGEQHQLNLDCFVKGRFWETCCLSLERSNVLEL